MTTESSIKTFPPQKSVMRIRKATLERKSDLQLNVIFIVSGGALNFIPWHVPVLESSQIKKK